MKIIQYKTTFKETFSKEFNYFLIIFLQITIVIFGLQFSAVAQIPDGNTSNSCNRVSFVNSDFFAIDSFEVDYIRSADVNNDGVSDVIVNLLNLGKISVQLGNGEGGLSEANEFITGGFPSDFELADINRDGELDILAVNETANQVALLLGDGNGNFTLSNSINVGSLPKLIEVGNFDSDQYLDFVIVYANSLTVFSGNRNLTFTQRGTVTTLFGAKKIEATDLNGDQITDLATLFFDSGAEKLQTYLGQNGGNLQLSTSIENINAETIATGDINNDGFTDFITAERLNADYTIFSFLGNGNGTFQTPITSTATSLFGLQLFDMNLDGKLDAVTNSGAVMLGSGTGTFTLLQNANYSNFAENVAFGDFNSDGFPDTSFTNQARTGININNREGGFQNVNEFGVNEFQLSRPTDSTTADFNLDGKDDFVVLNAQNNRAFVYIQTENGRFAPTPPEGLSVGGGFNVSPFTVTVADFNNDNIPDFVVGDSFARQIVIFTGNGDATFTVSRFTNSDQFSYTPRFIRTGDFNNDNLTDIVVTNNGGSYIIYLNNGNGEFTRLTPVPVGSSTNLRLVAVGDITNDGNLDMITGRDDLGELRLLTGNGTGTFVTSTFAISGVGSLAGIILEDLNNDGFLDLIVGGDRINVGFGVGNGGFFDVVTYDYEGNINDLEFFDFDGDGIKDLVASGGAFPFGAIFVLRGIGGGQFEQPVALNQFSYPQNITPGDFNNDGKIDLVAVSGLTVKALFNNTNDLPCISVNNTQTTEQSGNSTVTFDVTLSEPSAEQISVDYKTVGRTARSGVDFGSLAGTLTFAPGITNQTITVSVNDDLIDEDDETLTLTLFNASNAKLLDSVGVGTILNNDAPPVLIFDNKVQVLEGSGPSGTFIKPLFHLSEASGRKIKINVSTQDVTANAGSDYESFSEYIFFSPGDTQHTLSAKVISDFRVEPDEVFAVNLTNPVNVATTNNQLNVTILNDDVGGEVQFVLSDILISESSQTAQIKIVRTGGNASDVAVEYSTADGTAISGSDYQNTTGSVTFDANESMKIITVPIINDSLNENTETFNLSLQNVSGGGTLGQRTTLTVNIEDNDPLPRLSISSSSITEGNLGTSIFNLTINLLEPSGREVNVNYSTQNGTAIAPTDYLPVTGTVTFNAGETSKTVQLTIIGDTQFEPNETFNFILSSPNNAEIINGNAIITILNDDLKVGTIVPFDFDGDNKSDLSIFRPNVGQWWYLRSSDSSGRVFQFGNSDDRIMPADYTGDGKTDIALWRPSTGEWFIMRSEDNSFLSVPFGSPGDLPAPADFDADGKADLAIFRPSESNWYIQKSTGGTDILQFGLDGDVPIPADFDGDGKADLAIWRPSVGQWWMLRSTAGVFAISFGVGTDKPVAGDYTGDGKADIAFWRPSSGEWFILRSEDTSYFSVQFGSPGDIPAPGDYDGDGIYDLTVFRPSQATWYVNRTTAGLLIANFGADGDRPVPAAFIP